MAETKSRNRTIKLTREEEKKYAQELITVSAASSLDKIIGKIINQDFFEAVNYLPNQSVDLLILDPPYNMQKNFNGRKFKEMTIDEYTVWIENVIRQLRPLLKEDASVYFCSDWKTSTSVHLVLEKYFHVRNRITWEREKGRGSKLNWKNNSEDIWFCTCSNKYRFNIDEVKVRRKVIAPYRIEGKPKDWNEDNGNMVRITHPSNIWTDISVPFWSMPENTDHPTQKPEKLIAKLILASSKKGDVVLDPFSGAGTSCVVAKKLERNFVGIEIDTNYASLALKRLEIAETNKEIQGYKEGIFWERNSFPYNKRD
jgi:site-specific DNA-methyltransferase (adenine-specific)